MWTLTARPTAPAVSLVLTRSLAAGACRTPAPAPPEALATAPDWTPTGGRSPRIPDSAYLAGFAMAVGESPLGRTRSLRRSNRVAVFEAVVTLTTTPADPFAP